eukprot:261759_1
MSLELKTVSTLFRWMVLCNFLLIIGYITYCNQETTNDYAIAELSEHHDHDNELKDTVKFYIFWNFSWPIHEYFESCNESNLYGRHRLRHWANRNSHCGEKYFSMDSLRNHKWFDPQLNINDSDVLVIPVPLMLAANGYCRPNQADHNYYHFKNNKPFLFILHQLFDELFQLQLTQKILIIAHDHGMCHINRYMPLPSSAMHLGHQSRLIVGHYENRELSKHRPCFWQRDAADKQQRISRMVIIPYTIPFKYTEYNMYDDVEYNLRDFHSRRYKLFFIGSVCKKIGKKYDRLIAMEYMHSLNHVDSNSTQSKHLGVITDFDDLYEAKSCRDSHTIPICNASLDRLEALHSPCGLNEEMYHTLNRNNELYIYGLKHSQFNLMIHGDTPTSGKLYDSIAFNLINIIIGFDKNESDLYLPFTDIVPYEKFVFFVNQTHFREDGLNELKKIVYDTTEQQIEEMISYMTRYRRYLLWDHKESVVVDSILRQAQKTN